MDDLTRLVIENECRRLAVLYCHHLDHLNPDAFAALYAEDAVYKPAVEPAPIVGRPAILDWIRRYPRNRLGRHISTNHIVEVLDADTARGSSCAVVFREPDPQAGVLSTRVTPRSVVEYADTYRRTAEGWRFAVRTYQMQFLQAEESRRPVAAK